jgi:hypothetical protein
MNSVQIENELEELFSENIISINKNWISSANNALDEMFRKGIKNRNTPLDWGANDLNWDPVVNWLRTAIEHFQNPTAHYILLWLICDKVHGFWNRQREKSLDTNEMIGLIAWAMNTRICAVDALVCSPNPLSGPNIGHLFRNPLLFRMNPKVNLIPDYNNLTDMEVVLQRAFGILDIPLKYSDLTLLYKTFVTHHKIMLRSDTTSHGKRWIDLINGRDEHECFFLPDNELFDELEFNISDKQIKEWSSKQTLHAVISCWKDYICYARVCNITNNYLSRFILSEEGIGDGIH